MFVLEANHSRAELAHRTIALREKNAPSLRVWIYKLGEFGRGGLVLLWRRRG